MRSTIPSMTVMALLFILNGGSESACAGHVVVLQGNDRLAQVGESGQIEWEMKWGGIHDLHLLSGNRVMLQDGPAKVVEIDVKTRQVVWSYSSAESNGNRGKAVEVHSFQPLDGGRVMIAESGPARIIEINRAGEILKEIPLKVKHSHPHTDTRLVRRLKTGNYLVCHEGDGIVREYGPAGDIVWEFEVPLFGKEPKGGHGPEAFGNKAFAAVRLPNGNTLLSTGNGHGVIEVTPGKEIVWQLQQHDLAGVVLAWVTTLEVLPNGHYVIGNCHAGKGQPLLIEIDPHTKEIVWKFDRFDDFGNSVSNSQLLDQIGKSLR